MSARSFGVVALLVACAATFSAGMAGAAKEKTVALEALGSYETGIYDAVAAEIGAFDPASKRVFVTNSADGALDVLDVSDPVSPVKIDAIDLSELGGDPTSVAVDRGLVAVAVVADPKTDPGTVAFFDTDGNPFGSVEVGALPDMLVFTPNGRQLLVANEGEPNDAYTIDPEGTVAIVDLPADRRRLDAATVTLAGFDAFAEEDLDPSIRIFGPGASVAQDLEPEYVTVSHDSGTAWVSLQEANAIAELDLQERSVVAVRGLGFKDHSLAANPLDASDRDGPGNSPAVNIRSWPVLGMYQPDAIASYHVKGETYVVTANEGDARDYDGFAEEIRVGSSSYQLDPAAFPPALAAQLKANAALGRLTVTSASGDTDGDGDFDQIHAFGARSFSIRRTDGTLVWDSGAALERLNTTVGEFNSDNAENGSWDTRSDNKGPEPEGIAVGKIEGRWYAFVGLERIGGIAVFDITDPAAPRLDDYVNPRDFAGDAEAGTAGDLGPEGITFVPAAESPSGEAMLFVTNEVSGSTRAVAITGG